MISLRNTIAVIATAFALMAPMAAASYANSGLNGFEKSTGKAVHQRSKLVRYARYHPDRSIRTPRIDFRITKQTRRIVRGRRSGRLTRIEAVRLRGHLLAIRSARGFARVDGRVTRRERLRLNAMLHRNSKRIHRLSRNGRRR